MSQFYLPKQESEWVKSQPEGWLVRLIRREMSPAAEAKIAEPEPPPAAFTPARPKLLSGSALFHPEGERSHPNQE